ncbi:TonB-dependent receptor [Lacinutrix iliipiscaria]|uniref:TonB-dependent receptor n=1 Tax=Lacinutrix iliipiscaria TaxID=1230532 RepID=A0ABW5WJ05_9FLAO
MRTILSILLLFFCGITFAQTTITGTVVDDNGLPIPSANIIVVDASVGTVTDFDGNFTLNVDQNPPFTLQASSIGFESMSIEVTSNNQTLNFILNEGTALDEVVVSASRTPERIFESPVTVERFGLKEIKNTASADFYDGLENLKGVDINTNSLTFKSINTRGFAAFNNPRFMQLVDGMDNSAPALNFPLGNLIGMVETDVQSIELLPGAASALYGANAFNGILFMTSKNPFDHVGISGYIKQGITSQEAAGDNPYTDLGIRMAHKFSDKFAAKVNFGYVNGTDWLADSEADKLNRGLTRADLDYDGINIYGDEVSANIRAAGGGVGIIPNVVVSRTGYKESDLTDNKAESIKADWGLYYRPITDNSLEIAYVGKVGTGSTIYQGAQRYRIDGFFMQQHKLEIKNDNFFLRGYVTEDKAGDTYVMDATGVNINREWKSDADWFGDYIGTYVNATFSGATEAEAHAAARAVAEAERYEPGSPQFNRAFNKIINDPDLTTGSKFQDNSKIYHADANYNFSHLLDIAEIQVGGSYRKFSLNSFGTIYTDYDGPINYSEFGIYTQIQKSLDLNESMELKLTGSVRYDKAELFDGFFSPRISAGLTINKDHNIRGSFQTGFRNPSTQELFIGLDGGRAFLVGGAKINHERYFGTYDVSPFAQAAFGMPATITQTGESGYNNSMTASIATELGNHDAANNGREFVANPGSVKPEQVSSFELGYRGKVKGLVIDLSGYYNSYKDFQSTKNVIATYYGDNQNFDLTGYDPANPATVAGLNEDTQMILAALQNDDFEVYQTYTNTDASVNSYGAAIAVSTKVLGNFDLAMNYTFAKLDFDTSQDPDFRTGFNTPEHKVKASFGNTELFKNFGFNLAWKWSDSYLWEASFGDGDVPAYHTIDAQINYRIPSLKSTFKVGAANLLGDEYFTAFGSGFIGSQYYVSWTINNL